MKSSIGADIFLCHSSKDKEFVRKLASDLHDLKVDAWLDEWELQPGDSLIDRIGMALESSVFVGVVLSPASAESNWCKKELNQALSRELRNGEQAIVPIRLQGATIPPFLEEKFYLDVSEFYYPALARLCAKILQFDSRDVNVGIAKYSPESVEDIRLIFAKSNLADDDVISSDARIYRRLKLLASARNDIDLYLELGMYCFHTNRVPEARRALALVLGADDSFTTDEELNRHVRELARNKNPFSLITRTRKALIYSGILIGDEDRVLNAAYDSKDSGVLYAAGLYYLRKRDPEIETAIAYFVNATSGDSKEIDLVRQCDSMLYEALKDLKPNYPKQSWQYIEARVEEWNKHRFSLI